MSAESDYKEAQMDSVDHAWVEVPPMRGVADGAFGQGLIDFQLSISKPQAFLPAASYFRIEMEILGAGAPAAASQPLLREGLAFAENACANLFNNVSFKAGGQSVSEINSFVPQASMLRMRTSKTQAWQKSVGRTWGMNGSFAERCAAVSQSAVGQVGNAAPTGLSGMDDRREVMYKPTDAGAFLTASVSWVAATGKITGVGTAFSADDVGSTFVYAGQRYTIWRRSSATDIDINPSPSVDLAADAGNVNWYLIRRNVARSAQAKNRVFMIYKPPLGIFDAEDAVLGSGQYTITLNPEARFQECAVETINDSPVVGIGATNTYTLNIKSVQLYAATVRMNIPDSVQTLHLTEYGIQMRVMNSSNMNFSFSIPSSTNVVHVWLQDESAGTSARCPPSNFKVLNGSDLPLETIQLTYDGQVQPTTRWLSGFANNSPAGRNSAILQQLYNASLIARRSENAQGGAESFNEWLDRGAVYSFYWARSADSRSTDLQIQIGYNGAGLPSPGAGLPVGFDTRSKLFVACEYDRCVEVTTAGGLITAVRSLNV